MKRLKEAVAVLFILTVAYCIVSIVAWGFRHPWATETERFLYIPEAIAWVDVSYDEMRRRDP